MLLENRGMGYPDIRGRALSPQRGNCFLRGTEIVPFPFGGERKFSGNLVRFQNALYRGEAGIAAL